MSNSPSSATETPLTQEPAAVPDSATPEEDYIRLNRKELSNEIRRLQNEDSEFKQVYSSHVGDAAKRRYEPEIKARDNRIEELQTEIRRRDVQAMSPEEIEAKFESDEQFALEYAKLIHHRPQPQTAPVDETPIIMDAWNSMIDWAESKGVSKTKLNEVTQRAAAGEFSSDNVHWSVSLQRVQAELVDELVKPTKSEKVASTINPELTKKGADLTSASRGSPPVNFTFKTVADFKRLPISEQQAILRTPEGMEAVSELAKKG